MKKKDKKKNKDEPKPNTPAKASQPIPDEPQPIPDEPQSLFDKFANVGNDGEKYDVDPMPFAKKNPIQVCKHACSKWLGCAGFTTDQENELCVFKAARGNDVPNTSMTSYWKH